MGYVSFREGISFFYIVWKYWLLYLKGYWSCSLFTPVIASVA